ncbi:MAG: DUF3298 and DUF4163 domain-containing protein [Atribacterota bacterium]
MKRLFFLELVFLIVVVVVISGFIYTSVMAQENKAITQEITISDIVIKEDYEALEVDLTIPVIQGLEDKQVEEKINQTIQENILNFRYRIQTESEEYLQSAKSKGEEIRKYIAAAYYIVHYQTNDLLSLSVFYYCYTLGAHGCTVQEAYNLNLANGEEISLQEILKEKKDYVKIINQEIKRQIKLNPEVYFDDEVFHSISQEQPFYLIEDGIVIYFGLYEIAPYSSGIRYFKIPFALFDTSSF